MPATAAAPGLEATGREEELTEKIQRIIGKRTGSVPDLEGAGDTALTALGIDSLTLLRIVADVIVDPDSEIDPVELGAVETVADLHGFLNALVSGS